MKRSALVKICTISIFVSFLLNSCAQRDGYATLSGYAQGGTYSVKFNLRGVQENVEVIKDSIDVLLKMIDNSLSGYNKNSLLSRFNEGEKIKPDSLFGLCP